MADLTNWKNKEFRQLRTHMESLLREFFRDFGAPVFDEMDGETPYIDISETADAVVVSMELGDIDPEDIEITASPEALIIKGRKKENFLEQGSRVERRSTFSSRLKLPCRVLAEDVEAVLRDRTLEITLPKCRSNVFKKIPVRKA